MLSAASKGLSVSFFSLSLCLTLMVRSTYQETVVYLEWVSPFPLNCTSAVWVHRRSMLCQCLGCAHLYRSLPSMWPLGTRLLTKSFTSQMHTRQLPTLAVFESSTSSHLGIDSLIWIHTFFASCFSFGAYIFWKLESASLLTFKFLWVVLLWLFLIPLPLCHPKYSLHL